MQTLIGRVTNPKEQHIQQLLEDLPRNWTLKGRITSSDLGHECFQFRFDSEEDLLSVLNNRPYQFNGWMVILQRWEPVISATFPSQIPFWIRLKGLPLHFWHHKVIYDLGQDLGTLDDYKITDTTARVRVTLNGLKPIAQDAILVTSPTEEALITFEYEGIGRFCSVCFRLTHASRDCPLKPHQSSREPEPTERRSEHSLQSSRASYYRRESRYQPYPSSSPKPVDHNKGEFNQRLDRHGRPYGARVSLSQNQAQPLRNKITPGRTDGAIHQGSQRAYFQTQRETDDKLPPQTSQHNYSNRGYSYAPKEAQMVWREKRDSPRHMEAPFEEPVFNSPRISVPDDTLAPPRALERNLAISDFPQQPRIPTTAEVMQELVDVSIQYTNCSDPVESEARRQRVLQSNAEGIMEETAARIIAAATAAQSQLPPLPPIILPAPGQSMGSSAQPKRRGRPPMNKRQSPMTKGLAGASSRKRNLVAGGPSPGGNTKSASRQSKSNAGAAQSTSSDARTQNQQLQGRVEPQADFHTPALPPP